MLCQQCFSNNASPTMLRQQWLYSVILLPVSYLAVFAGTVLYQLPRDVLTLARVRFVLLRRHHVVALPVSVGRVRVMSRRRGVRDARRRHDPRSLARRLRPAQHRVHVVSRVRRHVAVAARHGRRQTHRAVVRLHATQVGRRGAGRVGHLLVHAVRLQRMKNWIKQMFH